MFLPASRDPEGTEIEPVFGGFKENQYSKKD